MEIGNNITYLELEEIIQNQGFVFDEKNANTGNILDKVMLLKYYYRNSHKICARVYVNSRTNIVTSFCVDCNTLSIHVYNAVNQIKILLSSEIKTLIRDKTIESLLN